MRKTKAKKRELLPDPKFGDKLVTRFVHELMDSGKKSLAFRIFYDAVELVEKSSGEEGHASWKKALETISPGVEVRSRRIGGATFQIPVEVRPQRKVSLGMKWLIKYAKQRRGHSMAEKLAAEIEAAAKGEGQAVKKKEDTHRMAEANKAFSHFKF